MRQWVRRCLANSDLSFTVELVIVILSAGKTGVHFSSLFFLKLNSTKVIRITLLSLPPTFIVLQ